MTDLTPSAGTFEGREHRLPVRVYYEDTDFTGVVYHANWLRFLERGRSDFLRLAATGHAELFNRDDPLAFVARRMEIEWVRPARIDDALVVRTTYDTIRGPRMFISQAIERDGEVLCRARIEIAIVGGDGRPRRPPRTMIEALKPWLQPQGDDA